MAKNDAIRAACFRTIRQLPPEGQASVLAALASPDAARSFIATMFLTANPIPTPSAQEALRVLAHRMRGLFACGEDQPGFRGTHKGAIGASLVFRDFERNPLSAWPPGAGGKTPSTSTSAPLLGLAALVGLLAVLR